MTEHPYGIWSVAPPVVAIVLAIATRRIVMSLVLGVFAGALLMARGDLLLAVYETWETHLWNTLIDPGKLRVFSFTLLMGALVGVITRSGGMRGLIGLVTPWARNRRRGQLATYGLGLLVFFDDYANTILIGNTMRPIADRLRISREKLAYLVDSTAAPVAGVALISTWIAVELDYIASGLASVPELKSANPFELFIATLPYRFYVWGALVFVPLTAILGRDFGPMLQAERRAVALGSGGIDAMEATDSSGVCEAGGVCDASGAIETARQAGLQRVSAWYHAAVPLLVTLSLVVYFLITTGLHALESTGELRQAPVFQQTPVELEVVGEVGGEGLATTASLRDIIGAADSTIALQYGALIGLFVAMGMAFAARLMRWSEAVDAALGGARLVIPAIAILWAASALSRMTTDQPVDGRESSGDYDFRDHRLYTADYLGGILAGQGLRAGSSDATAVNGPGYSVRWLPTIVFVISAAVAFSTGTSWGTMGILIPMVFPLARALMLRDGIAVTEAEPVLLATVAGVLAGAIFGDHCSPISDTTVLSSQSSGCDHLAHVWTQMPYAVAVGVVSIVLGTIPLGFGVSVLWLLPLQFIALFALLRLFGKPIDDR